MAATFKALGTAFTTWTGAASQAIGLPTYVATDVVALILGFRSSTLVAPAAPAGWDLNAVVSGGGGTFGVDTGPSAIAIYIRVMDGTEGSTVTLPAVASGSGSTFAAVARTISFSKNSNEEWSWVSTYGTDTTYATSWSVTPGDTIDIRANDVLLASSTIQSDTPTWSAYSVAATGATIGTMTNRINTTTTTGNDMRLYTSEATCTAGTATAKAILTGTLSASVQGAAMVTRLRATVPVSGDLTRWTTAAAGRLTAPAKILFVGDSRTEGQGVDSRAKTLLYKFAAKIRAINSDTTSQDHFQTATSMWAPSTWGVSSFTQTNGTYDTNVFATYASWPYYSWYTSTANANLVFTGTGQYVDVWYYGGQGTFTWKVDAGSETTVNNTGETGPARRVRINTGSNASHTVTIKHVSGTTVVTGVSLYSTLSDRDDGIHVFRAGHSGTEVRHFNAQQSAWISGIQQLAPDLVIIALGVNELLNNPTTSTPAAFETELTSMVTALQAMTPAPSVAIVSEDAAVQDWAPYSSWVQYVDKAKAVATAKGVKWIDLTAWIPQAGSLGNYRFHYDGVHHNDVGADKVASVLANSFAAVSTTVDPLPVASTTEAVSSVVIATAAKSPVASTTEAVSSVQAVTTAKSPVSVTTQAVSSVQAVTTAKSPASATAQAVSSVSITTTAKSPVSATTQAVSSVSITTTAKSPVSVTTQAVSSVSIATVGPKPITCTIDIVSSTQVTTIAKSPVSATTEAVSSVQITATTTNVPLPVSATVLSVSSVQATTTAKSPASGTTQAVSSVGITTTARSPVAATVNAVSSVQVTTTTRLPVGATTQAVSSVAATTTARSPVTATTQSVSSVSITATGPKPVTCTIEAISSSQAITTARSPVSGTTQAVSSVRITASAVGGPLSVSATTLIVSSTQITTTAKSPASSTTQAVSSTQITTRAKSPVSGTTQAVSSISLATTARSPVRATTLAVSSVEIATGGPKPVLATTSAQSSVSIDATAISPVLCAVEVVSSVIIHTTGSGDAVAVEYAKLALTVPYSGLILTTPSSGLEVFYD